MSFVMVQPAVRNTGDSSLVTLVKLLIILIVISLHLLVIRLFLTMTMDLPTPIKPKFIDISFLSEHPGQQSSSSVGQVQQLKSTKAISKKIAPVVTKSPVLPKQKYKSLSTKPHPIITAPNTTVASTISTEPGSSVSTVGGIAATQSTANNGSGTRGGSGNAGNTDAKISAGSAKFTPPRFDAGYLSNPEPDYPEISREMGEEGRVLLTVSVSALGKAMQVRLHKSSRFDRLDKAAIDAVRHWTFVPGRVGDEPVVAEVIVPVNFYLQ